MHSSDKPTTLHANPVFSVRHDGHYHYVEYNRCKHGAVVVPVFPNGDFLLVRLRRAPMFGYSTEFPRGGAEPGETLVEAACRELREETGHVVSSIDVEPLGTLAADTATINSTSGVFVARLRTDNPEHHFDTSEIAETVRVTPAVLTKMILDGLVRDGQTIAAYGLLKMRSSVVA